MPGGFVQDIVTPSGLYNDGWTKKLIDTDQEEIDTSVKVSGRTEGLGTTVSKLNSSGKLTDADQVAADGADYARWSTIAQLKQRQTGGSNPGGNNFNNPDFGIPG